LQSDAIPLLLMDVARDPRWLPGHPRSARRYAQLDAEPRDRSAALEARLESVAVLFVVLFAIAGARGGEDRLASSALLGSAEQRMPAASAAGGRASALAGGRTARESAARSFARTIRADPKVTTLEQLLWQIPDVMRPRIESSDTGRTLAWPFDGGSQLAATFRPVHGDGPGCSLVLRALAVRN
jgi:hypothetical protein